MYEQAIEARGNGVSSPARPGETGGVRSAVVAACERVAKLISLHDDMIRVLHGPQPEPSQPGTTAREPQAISDFVQILHQELSTLEQQSIQLANALV